MIKRPLLLNSNRVWRTYKGGHLLSSWQGKEGVKDDNYTEEWVASVTSAARADGETTEGLSEYTDEDGKVHTLKELVDSNPPYYLGDKHFQGYSNNTGVLVKVLDSAERLIIQVHPDNVLSKLLFDSRFGKTECWYIIGSREVNGEKPYVLFGFKEGITRERWKMLFKQQDIADMKDALNRFEVEVGDVFLINGGMPHAIGPGCLILEIQEPTDITIRMERASPSGQQVHDYLIHRGLGFEKMFDCFYYDGLSKKELKRKYKIDPVLTHADEDAEIKTLISYEHTPCFSAEKYCINTFIRNPFHDTFSCLVVESGEGTIVFGNGILSIKQGQQIFLPAGLDEFVIKNKKGRNKLVVVRCFPPLI